MNSTIGPQTSRVQKEGWLQVQGRLWLVELPDEYSAGSFASEFARLKQKLERQPGPVVVLIDAHRLKRTDAKNREVAGSFFKNEKELVQRKVVAWSFVTPNSLLRGAIAAISWLGKFPVPTKTFDTKTQAMAWLQQALAARGLSWE